jgi:hypothetical protein
VDKATTPVFTKSVYQELARLPNAVLLAPGTRGEIVHLWSFDPDAASFPIIRPSEDVKAIIIRPSIIIFLHCHLLFSPQQKLFLGRPRYLLPPIFAHKYESRFLTFGPPLKLG